jgi:hypothetical protein
MAWGINDVNTVVFPLGSRSGRRYGNTPFLFLLHPVHYGRTFMGIANFICAARIIQNALSQGGLTGINMRHDSDISGSFQRESTIRHFSTSILYHL